MQCAEGNYNSSEDVLPQILENLLPSFCDVGHRQQLEVLTGYSNQIAGSKIIACNKFQNCKVGAEKCVCLDDFDCSHLLSELFIQKFGSSNKLWICNSATVSSELQQLDRLEDIQLLC
jgi:hypothetical protein